MKYGLIGYSGRLGSEVLSLFNESGHKCVARIDNTNFEFDSEPDLLIDCSLPEAFGNTIDLVEKYNVPLVIGTTGLNNAQIEILKSIANNQPVVQSFNFSIGIQVLLKLASQAKEIIEDWDVEISETHHRFKKDKPSGTAIMIQDLFKGQNINTSSLRLGNVSGDHTVSFGGLGEVLSINHRALSRRTFAEGILRSSEFLLEADSGFYTFTEVLFGKQKDINWR